MKDFRSDPMPSADGLGTAKRNFREVLKALGVSFDETLEETVAPFAIFAHQPRWSIESASGLLLSTWGILIPGSLFELTHT